MELDPSTNLITYSGVPEVAGATAADLYDRAFKWGQDYYKNFGEKLRKQDKEGGEIEIFARFPIFVYDKKGVKTTSRQGLAQYTLILRFREGRYKYTVTKLNLKEQSYQPLEKWLDREDPNATKPFVLLNRCRRGNYCHHQKHDESNRYGHQKSRRRLVIR